MEQYSISPDMPILILLAALAAGAANPFQAGTNAALNRTMGQPLWATLCVYASGLAGVLVLLAIVRPPLPAVSTTVAQAPWWAWMGGLLSILATVAGVTLAQRLGSGVFTAASVSASLVVSIALDHFGLIGFRQHTASPMRLAGAALLAAGVWMVARF